MQVQPCRNAPEAGKRPEITSPLKSQENFIDPAHHRSSPGQKMHDLEYRREASLSKRNTAHGDENELDLKRIRDPGTGGRGRIVLGYSRKPAIGSTGKESSRVLPATRSDSARGKKLAT
jgi:hypothetical protein